MSRISRGSLKKPSGVVAVLVGGDIGIPYMGGSPSDGFAMKVSLVWKETVIITSTSRSKFILCESGIGGNGCGQCCGSSKGEMMVEYRYWDLIYEADFLVPSFLSLSIAL
jgi:hypothetical protein